MTSSSPSEAEGRDATRPGAPPSSGVRGSQRFPRSLRLKRRGDFLRIQRRGVKHHMRNFLVFVAPMSRRTHAVDADAPHREDRALSLPEARLGVTVTRKVGGAVARNRIKRLVREAFRRERQAFAPGIDMVWVAKQGTGDVSYEEVVDDVRRLARRLAGAAKVQDSPRGQAR